MDHEDLKEIRLDLADAEAKAEADAEAEWRAEAARAEAEAWADAEMARWDDDPSPYNGDFCDW